MATGELYSAIKQILEYQTYFKDKLSIMEGQISTMAEQIDNMSNEMSDVTSNMTEIQTVIEGLEDNFTNITNDISLCEGVLNDIKPQINTLYRQFESETNI